LPTKKQLDNVKNVIWIASYPKSGNTWMRFLACNLVFGSVDSAAALNRLAPDIHEVRVIEPPARRVLLKTHFPYSKSLPLAEHTAGAVYILRDPADVMLSNFHYSHRSGATADSKTAFAAYVDAFIDSRGVPRWSEMGMGNWDQNVASWLAASRDFPVLKIRYEDVLANGRDAAVKLCQFLGLERSDPQIDSAVAGASFSRLREIEEADIRAQRVGIFYKPYLKGPIDAGFRFMRAGASGGANRTLSDIQRTRFDAAFGAIRRELGYS